MDWAFWFFTGLSIGVFMGWLARIMWDAPKDREHR